MFIDNVHVVIRTAGERTARLCTQLISLQVAPEAVVEISEVPFSRAVRRTLEIGLYSQRPWTLALDADVLVFRHAVKVLLARAHEMPKHFFMIEGRVIDKIFGGPRAAGMHLYRSDLFEQALEVFDENANTHRPESRLRDAMWKLGHPTRWIEDTVGLHDFEQYRRDYYRKGFVHGQKHAIFVPILMPMWHRLSKNDLDYAAVVAGAIDGLREGGIAHTDIRRFGCVPQNNGILIREKDPLRFRQQWHVERISRTWSTEPEFYAYERKARKLARKGARKRLARNISSLVRPARWLIRHFRRLALERLTILSR